jgi:peptidoglycan/LPS O-acetylase OafA/YrhL
MGSLTLACAVHPSETTKPRSAFVWRLQSVRGIAALVVAVYHSVEVFPATPNWTKFYRGLTNLFYGPGAVFTFFILSGFVLGLSLARKGKSGVSDIWPFLKHRFWRLFPALLGTTLIYVGFQDAILSWLPAKAPAYFAFHRPDFREIVRNLTMLAASINPVTWSLQVEWLFSLLIPLTVIWTGRRHVASVVVLVVCLGLYYFAGPSSLHRTPTTVPWCYLFMCYAGSTLALYQGSLPTFFREMPKTAKYSLLTLSGIVCASTPHFGNHIEIFTLAMVLVIAAIASDDFPILFHFLDAKPLVFLGNVSYSFYLLHPLALATVAVILCCVTPADFPQKHFGIAALLVAVFSILLAVPLAQISFLLLEKPFLRRR